MPNQKYPLDLREKVAQECIEVGSIKSVAIKHGFNPKTVHNWVKTFKNKDVIEDKREFIKIRKQLADAQLENQILKELLKKTVQVWSSDVKS